jgi:zinc protease
MKKVIEQSLPNPDNITRRELANGIVVLVKENHANPAVFINGSIDAGGAYITREQAGLPGFVASCLMRGTEKRDFAAINEAIENIGASLRIGAGNNRAGFGGKALSEDFGTLIELLAEVVRTPTFPAQHVERRRGELVTSLLYREHDTQAMANLTFQEMLYPEGHPYSFSSSGYVETVQAFTRDDLADFHSRVYGPQRMILCVVGAIDAGAAIAEVEKAFGDWQNPDQPDYPGIPDVPAPSMIRRRDHVIAGKTQSDLVLGFPGPSRHAEDWQAANMANSILGQFGLMGRLGEVVREKHGLAYYSYSVIGGSDGPSPWACIAGVAPGNVELAINSILGEIDRMVREQVSDEDINDNKAYFTGRLPLRLETNGGVASFLLSMERYGLGLDYVLNYKQMIGALTKDDLLAACQHYLNPNAYAVAVAGPELAEGGK